MIRELTKLVITKNLLEWSRAVRKQLNNFGVLSKEYGQWNSIKTWSSVDNHKQPIPWYTYPATEYLEHLDFSNLSVFEWGSGNSTLWWASRARYVRSVEDDKIWFELTQENLGHGCINVDYHFVEKKTDYMEEATGDFDVYIIDGSYRRGCAERLIKLDSKAIMVIFDNSDKYGSTISYLRKELNWVQIDFHGFGPINDYTWTTSIFINPRRLLDISYATEVKSRSFRASFPDDDATI